MSPHRSGPVLFNAFSGHLNYLPISSEINLSLSSKSQTTGNIISPNSQKIFKEKVDREYEQVLGNIRLAKQRQGLIYDEFEHLIF